MHGHRRSDLRAWSRRRIRRNGLTDDIERSGRNTMRPDLFWAGKIGVRAGKTYLGSGGFDWDGEDCNKPRSKDSLQAAARRGLTGSEGLGTRDEV